MIETFMLPVKLLDDGGDSTLLLPQYRDDVGVDVRASEEMTIGPGETKLIGTGITFALPDGVECQVRPRSGLALKLGLTVLNSPGTIDPQYRGEVKIMAHNANQVSPRKMLDLMRSLRQEVEGLSAPWKLEEEIWNEIKQKTVHIQKGDRIAQLVFAKYLRAVPDIVEKLPDSLRSDGGFGSTGKA